MCGRYVQSRSKGDLLSILNARAPAELELRENYNVAPTTDVPILIQREEDGELHREIHAARWGLLPIWAKDKKQSYKTFNARSETVTEKASFRSAVRSKRCAIPADAYYEWLTEGKIKHPHAIRPKDGGLITFAGLYEWWKDPEAPEDHQWLLSCTILTGPAPTPDQHQDLATLHDRLPLPLSEETLVAWVHPDKLEKPEAAELVDYVRSEAYEVAAGWEVYPVSKDAGNVRNNGSKLLEPVSF